jgi:hypothetical protein
MRGNLRIKRSCGLSGEYGAISNTLLLRVFHHGEVHVGFRTGFPLGRRKLYIRG